MHICALSARVACAHGGGGLRVPKSPIATAAAAFLPFSGLAWAGVPGPAGQALFGAQFAVRTRVHFY